MPDVKTALLLNLIVIMLNPRMVAQVKIMYVYEVVSK